MEMVTVNQSLSTAQLGNRPDFYWMQAPQSSFRYAQLVQALDSKRSDLLLHILLGTGDEKK